MTLEDGAWAVGSRDTPPRGQAARLPRGELAPWPQSSSFASSLLHHQTCVSKPGVTGLGFQR